LAICVRPKIAAAHSKIHSDKERYRRKVIVAGKIFFRYSEGTRKIQIARTAQTLHSAPDQKAFDDLQATRP
jgi:hypothetical protein